MPKAEGIRNLDLLLKEMSPELIEGEFVFCTISERNLRKLEIIPLLTFKEQEGITIIIEKSKADQNRLSYSEVWKMVTLQVHSNLSAIGFLAKITRELAGANISVNVVSAYHHDHLFVPASRATEALIILNNLTKLNK